MQINDKTKINNLLIQLKEYLKGDFTKLSTKYVEECENIYKTVIELYKLKYNVTKQMYNKIRQYIRVDISESKMELCYFLFTDLSTLSSLTRLKLEFDNIFFKNEFENGTKRPLCSLYHNNSIEEYKKYGRNAYIRNSVLKNKSSYECMSRIINYTTSPYTIRYDSELELLVKIIKEPHYNIDIDILLKNSFDSDEIILLCCIIIAKDGSVDELKVIESFLLNKYNENSKKLLELKYDITLSDLVMSLNNINNSNGTYTKLIDMCILYTLLPFVCI